MPFLSTFDIKNKGRKYTLRSQAPYYENMVKVSMSPGSEFITTLKESTDIQPTIGW